MKLPNVTDSLFPFTIRSSSKSTNSIRPRFTIPLEFHDLGHLPHHTHKMRFSSSTRAGLLAVTTLLSSVNACLLKSDATTLTNNFGKLVTSYSQKLANQTLATNFIDYSESVNSLEDNGGDAPVALLGQTFSSRAAFESASASQPSIPFAVKQLWYTCDTITARWESDQSPKPVVGISVFHTVLAPIGQSAPGTLYQIDEIWGEFDSAAWLTNLGILKQAKAKREVAFEA